MTSERARAAQPGPAGEATVAGAPWAPAAAQAVRREGGREVPLGGRGAATREKLLLAARHVFETQGYVSSSVAQISERAGVSQGTYYQYFRDRSDIMATLISEHVANLLENPERSWRVRDGRQGLRRMMLAYVSDYAQRAPFFRVWEEVSHIDPRLAEVRRGWTRLLESSIETELRRGAAEGLLADLDEAAVTSRALTAMADRFCYLSYVVDPATPPLDPEEAAEHLTRLWAGAIGLRG